ncbi:MAG: amidohydrolase [Clostridia bacterium]|nr:amidohydrolase [Clostridia bacterium]
MTLINGKIYTCKDEEIIENGFIKIKDGIIEKIGDMKDYIKETEEIDLSGMLIFPGFIDAHCHIGMWEDGMDFEGDDGNEDTDPCTPHLRGIDGINPLDRCFEEALEGGVTTVVTGPGSANPIGGTFSILKTGKWSNIDDMIFKSDISMKMALGENPKRTYNGKDQAPKTRMATMAIIREALKKAIDYKEKIDKYNMGEEEDRPDVDVKSEALIPVLERKIPLHIHAHRADDIYSALRIKNEFNVDVKLVHCTEGYMISDVLKNAGVDIFAGPNLCDRSKIELRNSTCENPVILNNCNLNVSIITDHPVTPIQFLPVCAGLAMRGGMSYYDAIKSITINPAKALNIDDRLGSLEVGKDADIVVFKNDPFDIKNMAEYVFIKGKRAR